MLAFFYRWNEFALFVLFCYQKVLSRNFKRCMLNLNCTYPHATVGKVTPSKSPLTAAKH